MALPIKTPCTTKCRTVGDICIKCKRTMKEIINWGSYSNKQRTKIMKELDKR